MKTFSIYEHPDHRLEAVKQGISFPGLLLGGVWLLSHRMWISGALATGGGLVLYLLFPSPEGYVFGIPYGHRFGLADIMNLGICGVVAFCGNGWRATSLLDRGFDDMGTEQAATPDGAKAAFLRRTGIARHEPGFVRREPV
jgi:hypothetical protein